MKTCRYIPVALFVAGVAACLATYGREHLALQRFEYLMETGKPVSLSQETVDSLLAKVIPLVESAAGRKFVAAPVARVADRSSLVNALSLDVDALMRVRSEKELTFEQSLDLLGTLHIQAQAMLGKYSPTTKEVLIVPENFVPAFAAHGHAVPDEVDEVVMLMLAHELTHAMQDQLVQLASILRQPTTIEDADAVTALIEGHAMLVQEEVARGLGIKSANDRMVAMMTERAIGSNPATQLPLQTRHTYRAGYEILKPLHRSHGAQAHLAGTA